MKVIVACDSFKGSLTSDQANQACIQGLVEVMPQCHLKPIIMADGGEGTTIAIATAYSSGHWVETAVCDPLGRKINARYFILPDRHTAVMETAAAAGLTTIDSTLRNPMLTDTCGLGQMMADAIARGCHKIILGLGGSATNDAGIGMLQALGVKFADHNGNIRHFSGGKDLMHLGSVYHVPESLYKISVTCLCDVTNHLLGDYGATKIFAPQKGADPNMVELLEEGMTNYATLLRPGVANTPGAGAAGGLGASIFNFFRADLCSGVDMILDLAGFDSIAANADLIITGEGRVDSTSLMGKVVGGIIRRTPANIPVIVLGGTVEPELSLSSVVKVHGVTPDNMPLSTAMQPEVATENIRSAIVGILTGKHRHS